MRTTGSWGSFFFPLSSQLHFFFNKQSDHRVLSFTTLGNFLSTSLMRVISQLGLTIGYVFTVTPWRPECGWFLSQLTQFPAQCQNELFPVLRFKQWTPLRKGLRRKDSLNVCSCVHLAFSPQGRSEPSPSQVSHKAEIHITAAFLLSSCVTKVIEKLSIHLGWLQDRSGDAEQDAHISALSNVQFSGL